MISEHLTRFGYCELYDSIFFLEERLLKVYMYSYIVGLYWNIVVFTSYSYIITLNKYPDAQILLRSFGLGLVTLLLSDRPALQSVFFRVTVSLEVSLMFLLGLSDTSCLCIIKIAQKYLK